MLLLSPFFNALEVEDMILTNQIVSYIYYTVNVMLFAVDQQRGCSVNTALRD